MITDQLMIVILNGLKLDFPKNNEVIIFESMFLIMFTSSRLNYFFFFYLSLIKALRINSTVGIMINLQFAQKL